MRRQLVPALVVFLFFTLLVGVVYPLAVTGVARIAFPSKSQGSLVRRGGAVVGSRLIGQTFNGPRYFQSRPSAAGTGYDGAASAASNLGPSSPVLLADVRTRIAAYRRFNGLAAGTPVPVDAVTASGSGLDPEISPANARLQAPRVARARGVPLAQVLALVRENTDGRSLGFLGEPGVNVLALNLALDSSR
jgi:potassium-transporting ATPase KdpC subunit